MIFPEQIDPKTFNKIPVGINIISTDPKIIDSYIDYEMRQYLQINGLLNFNFKDSINSNGLDETERSCLKLLKQCAGEIIESDFDLIDQINESLDEFRRKSNYILTEDNVNKMVAIVKRFECDLPVVISGILILIV
jgi:hypothetical protein